MTSSLAPTFDAVTPADAPLPLDEIRSLVDERGRYEGWLEALDARRAATPPHVLERVRQDYAGRLDRVAQQLATHAAPLRAHEEALARQHHDVEQTLGEQRDTLAEIELRTLVGEYAPEEGEQRRAGAQDAISALERELGGAATALADVRALAVRVTPATAVAPEPAPPAGEAAPALAAAHQAGTPAQPTYAVPGQPAAGSRDYTSGGGFDGGSGFDHSAVDAARVALGDREPSLTPTFTDVVRGTPAGAFANGSRTQTAEPAGATQEKTLRCQDCGAPNYPTEWYCEKCGGELAAL